MTTPANAEGTEADGNEQRKAQTSGTVGPNDACATNRKFRHFFRPPWWAILSKGSYKVSCVTPGRSEAWARRWLQQI